MPSHYLYVCGNGHEEMRYRNSSRCRKCGLPILRKDAPLPDKELQSLRAQNAALLAEVERLKRERSEWCDQADQKLTEYMTQQRDLLAENAALRERLTTVPDMRWWHETPYPEDIWTMTTEQYVAAVPDPQLRTAISGYLMRAGWKVAAQTIKEALEEYALLAAGLTEEALQ